MNQSLQDKTEGTEMVKSQNMRPETPHSLSLLASVQLGLFRDDKTIRERFEAWKSTPGGAQIMNRAYRIAAGFVPRFQKTGQRVSMDYVFHILRYRIAAIKRELKRRQIDLPPDRGFALNNDYTAYIARHILAHKPEWAGLFETRGIKTGANGSKPALRRRVIVIEERREQESAVRGVSPFGEVRA